MSLAKTVASLAHQHARIVANLDDLAYIPDALVEVNNRVDDLNKRLAKAKDELKTSRESARKELDEHLALQGSFFLKYAHRALGKGSTWAAKAEKEEREAIAASDKVTRDEAHVAELQKLLSDAERDADNIHTLSVQRETLRGELDLLYKVVFDGPTPDASQDDELEWAVQRAENDYKRLQDTANTETHMFKILTEAAGLAKECVSQMQDCTKARSREMWSTDPRDPNLALHDALTMANVLARQFDEAISRAQKHDERAAKDLQGIKLPKNDMLRHPWGYDNNLQTKDIRLGLQSASEALDKIQEALTRSSERVKEASRTARTATNSFENARERLYSFRRTRFEQLAVLPPELPPNYVGRE